jgi:hypothetical protein
MFQEIGKASVIVAAGMAPSETPAEPDLHSIPVCRMCFGSTPMPEKRLFPGHLHSLGPRRLVGTDLPSMSELETMCSTRK